MAEEIEELRSRLRNLEKFIESLEPELSMLVMTQRRRNQEHEDSQIAQLYQQKFKRERELENERRLYECQICREHTCVDGIYIMDTCGHMFCRQCLMRYIVIKINEGITKINCPHRSDFAACNNEFGYGQVQQIISLQQSRNEITYEESCDLIGRYESLLFEETMRLDENFVRCPNILHDHNGEAYACNMWAQVEDETAHCLACHHIFCKKCEHPPHQGTCEEFLQFLSETDVDSANAQSLMSVLHEEKAKKCKGCGYYVIKNRGCNHMTCRCGYQFFYCCGAEYTTAAHHCS